MSEEAHICRDVSSQVRLMYHRPGGSPNSRSNGASKSQESLNMKIVFGARCPERPSRNLHEAAQHSAASKRAESTFQDHIFSSVGYCALEGLPSRETLVQEPLTRHWV
jgi:hypothetical protein